MSSDGDIWNWGCGLAGLPQTGCTDTRTRRERTSWSEDALPVVRILLFAERGNEIPTHARKYLTREACFHRTFPRSCVRCWFVWFHFSNPSPRMMVDDDNGGWEASRPRTQMQSFLLSFAFVVGFLPLVPFFRFPWPGSYVVWYLAGVDCLLAVVARGVG